GASGGVEEAAACVVGALRDGFVDEGDELASVLVRFYKTACFEQLDDGLRAIARGILGEARPDPDMRCLTLLATAGEEPEWNDRARSRRHQCIPLPSGERVAAMPMIAQLLRQLGVDLRSFDAGSAGIRTDLQQHTVHTVFYVPEAVGNPCIPDQQGFVIPHGVRSVVGFGGTLPGRQIFAVILFARCHISRETAALFGPLSLSVKLALMDFHP